MALKKVGNLYVDEDGRLLADVESGERIIICKINAVQGKPGGNDYKYHPEKPAPEYMLKTTDYLTMALTRAANRLLATQNKDGGWEWNAPDTNPSHGVPSPYNTLGVTAQGVLDSYRKVPGNRCLKACDDTYEAMVENSEDPNPAKRRIRGPDIPFLVELSEATIDSTYAAFAKARWVSAVAEFGGGTPTGFAEFIRDARKGQGLPALISWDINLYIQGMLALDRYSPGEGYTAQAKAMAEVIYNSLYVEPVDFDITDDTQNEFWLGITGALEAFVTTETHPTEVAALVTKLVDAQEDDGHFAGVDDGSDVQTTAYAALALIKAGQDRAVVSALNYLVGCQREKGGWLYDDVENTEITSETAQAIYDFIS